VALSVRFWGTRGSVPAPGASTVRYGGNTPCVQLSGHDAALTILDAGTGIRELGRSWTALAKGAPVSADIFLSHAHWDHIQGLPHFEPLFVRGNQVRIWSSIELMPSVERAVREQMSGGVFPVPFDGVGADVTFCTLGERRLGDAYVLRSHPVRHPGGSVAYRIAKTPDERGGLVYISDNELGDAPQYRDPPGWRERLLAFIRGASLLVHDAMYTVEEYQQHVGWGHSHVVDTVLLAIDAGVDRLALFHHRPERSDADVDRLVEQARQLAKERGSRLEILAAAEGLTLTV
jgi:phosphoribosyl 1,2-cyclic phosphodiesterase